MELVLAYNYYFTAPKMLIYILATVECYHVSVSVLVLVNTFNSSTWYLKYQ